MPGKKIKVIRGKKALSRRLNIVKSDGYRIRAIRVIRVIRGKKFSRRLNPTIWLKALPRSSQTIMPGKKNKVIRDNPWKKNIKPQA